MNADTIKNYKGPVRKAKFPWADWLKGSEAKPTVLTFGKDIPEGKTPEVLTAQLHQHAKANRLFLYTSVSADKKTISFYTVQMGKGKNPVRPESKFTYPKTKEKPAMAKKKAAASKDAKKSPKKAAKKKPAAKKAE